MKGREVERHLGAEVLREPLRELVDLGVGIVLAGNEQRRHLEPRTRLLLQVGKRLQHGPELPAADLAVEAFREALQVHVRRVHVPEKLLARGVGHVAGRHGDVPDPTLTAGLCDVDGVFQEDDRVVVRVGDAAAAGLDGCPGDRLRRGLVLQPVELPRLRDIPVLAELAGQVATGGAEGQHRRAGEEVIEGFFLDRVDAEAAGAAPGRQQDLVARAAAHEAQPALALAQLAEAGTQVALDPPVVQPVPVAARHAPNVGVSGHGAGAGRAPVK